MDRFYSNEPVRAFKQYQLSALGGPYTPLTGKGAFFPGRWYDAMQSHSILRRDGLTECTEECMIANELHHGFHAWKPGQADGGWRGYQSRWLIVELAGIVIEHEKGYRATRQKIIREMTEQERIRQIGTAEIVHIILAKRESENRKHQLADFQHRMMLYASLLSLKEEGFTNINLA